MRGLFRNHKNVTLEQHSFEDPYIKTSKKYKPISIEKTLNVYFKYVSLSDIRQVELLFLSKDNSIICWVKPIYRPHFSLGKESRGSRFCLNLYVVDN